MGNIDDTVQREKLHSNAVDLMEGLDASKYYNKYVAFAGFGDRRIVASGTDPVKVIKEAVKEGFKESVLVYVPNPHQIQVYKVA